MTELEKEKYIEVPGVLSEQTSNLLFDYLKFSYEQFKVIQETSPVKYNSHSHGFWDESQSKRIYSRYGDPMFDMLLLILKDRIEEATKLSLVPTYSYSRLYVYGCDLLRHVDRHSCEISVTLCLGHVGEKWPIFIGGIPLHMSPGDMVIYRGCDIEHWREPFQGEAHGQVFLHYNDGEGQYSSNNLYDKRIFLGLPPRK